ncbi:MAG TPA: hypothetical protein DEP35_23735 [Deltaproteobacteria bacterium]|nr:hypothetical protein [Deltaproteobacteria bacterium]
MVVLIHADAVESRLRSELELVHEIVVHAVRLCGIEEARVDVDPNGRMLLFEVVREIRVRHEVEPKNFHESLPHANLVLGHFNGPWTPAWQGDDQGVGRAHVTRPSGPPAMGMPQGSTRCRPAVRGRVP